MLTRRIIPCLDVRDGRVVKGVSFQNLRDMGDPAELAQRYEDEGADEIVVLDISATLERRGAALDLVTRVRNAIGIPLAVGGGVRTFADGKDFLEAGADRVSVNTAAVERPELVAQIAERFGKQCAIVAIDARQTTPGKWNVVTHAGRQMRDLDVVAWARQVENLGAGEILLTSFDQDGQKNGYDLGLISAVAQAVRIPVVASGGAYEPLHFDAGLRAGASALLAASLFHEGRMSVRALKNYLIERNWEIRQC